MASILNSKSHDLKHGGTFGNHCEVTILSIKSLATKGFFLGIRSYGKGLILLDSYRGQVERNVRNVHQSYGNTAQN